MSNLVLIRHGESTWNQENRFTGWTDVDLTEHGIKEAHQAAQLLKDGGYCFDIAFTSFLKRAIRTLWIILDDMDLMWLPVHGSWRLNERHYGALQGLNKTETAEKYGEAQVHIWRRSYSVKPPALEKEDMRWPGHDPRYQILDKKDIPMTECLKDTVDRFLPYWENTIAPAIIAGRKIIIAAHGNTLRALVMHLDHVSDDEIAEFDIPTGIPLVYELNDELKPISHHYLGDPDQVKKATDAVGKQGSVLR